MKLAAIYNVWDGIELLGGSMKCLEGHIDQLIIVYQVTSNFGEKYDPLKDIISCVPKSIPVKIIKYEPDISIGGLQNETLKRNIGLDHARALGCTHFLHLDCDEYYQDFGQVKNEFISSNANGSVVRIYTYFKKPTWRLENYEGYFVPFIHELLGHTKSGRSSYPYYCDPTRTINEGNVVCLSSQPMHHYSWVRNDIKRKARNSSASPFGNKLQGLLDDYFSPQLESDPENYIIKDLGNQRLKIVPDHFAIGDKILSL